MLNTLYISSQPVPDSSFKYLKRGGTSNILSLTTCKLSIKLSTLACPPPEQCTIPVTLSLYKSSIFLITGAYVLVGDNNNLPKVKPVSGSISSNLLDPV